MQIKSKLLASAALGVALTLAGAPALVAAPGAGDKLCKPGQTNVGGGGGNSGPGDKAGAPLKPAPSCPGPDN